MRLVQVQNFLADDHGGKRVQFAGGFIVKDQLRFDDQRARDGDALFHAAGKVARHFIHDVLETDIRQFFRDDLLRFLPAA